MHYETKSILDKIKGSIILATEEGEQEYANIDAIPENVSFNLYDVYGTRAAFKSDKLPTILQYLFSACIIVFPVIIVYGLNKKKRILALAATICQLLAFFADGRKSTIFVLIATILGYYFIHNLTARMIPAIMMGVTVVGFIEKICSLSSCKEIICVYNDKHRGNSISLR